MTKARSRSPLRALIALPLAAAWAGAASAQTPPAQSPRNANYTIEVALDPVARTIEGTQTLRWTNITQSARADELWFHLYWNAWRNDKSTWLREAALPGAVSPLDEPGRGRGADVFAYSEVTSITLVQSATFSHADLTASARYEAPDDYNVDDRTVLVVPLPRAVGPGETIELRMVWRAKVPRTFARTGFRGDDYFFAHWHPKIGVLQEDGRWNCRQFHRTTEFFSDYGNYDVKMTVPRDWRVGATGLQEGEIAQGAGGGATHHYRQEDVHDFAWTTSPNYEEAVRRFEREDLPGVAVRLLHQPEHKAQVDRHFNATFAALELYGRWYGPYPYGNLTVIDPGHGTGFGGMEYPTLFTAGTLLENPFGGGSPEGVTVHEAGHQFWYGLVGNNEFEDAWLDEGLNTFSTNRVMFEAFGPTSHVQRFFRDMLPIEIDDVTFPPEIGSRGRDLNRYRLDARAEIPATPTFRYHPTSAASITYSKTALWLMTLERTLGWETLQPAMAAFFERYRFRHPKPEDFFNTLEEVTRRDLTPFFDRVHRDNAVFDYAVTGVTSRPIATAQGYVESDGRLLHQNGAPIEPVRYETRAIVRRMADGRLPVELGPIPVRLVYVNGDSETMMWDGQSVWTLLEPEPRPSRLHYAEIDPDKAIALDINRTNNSKMTPPETGRPRADLPAEKWSSRWMIWLQDFMQTLAFLF